MGVLWASVLQAWAPCTGSGGAGPLALASSGRVHCYRETDRICDELKTTPTLQQGDGGAVGGGTYDGNVETCRVFQRNANTPAMIPATTSRTATTMAIIAPADTERTSAQT